MTTPPPPDVTITALCPWCGLDCEWSGRHAKGLGDGTDYVCGCGCEEPEQCT